MVQESEYAAWVLVNGYALNHATIAGEAVSKGGVARQAVLSPASTAALTSCCSPLPSLL